MRWGIRFSVINAKGGVGKTTTAVNMAAMAVDLGKPDEGDLRVLVVDVDHQTNATQQLGYDDLDLKDTLAGHVEREADLRPIIIQNACGIKGLDLLPSHPQLVYSDEGILARGTWLRRMLRDIVREYDLTIFDCPADFGPFTINALSASEGVIIPTQAEKHSVSGLPLLIARARQIFEETECPEPWAYVLITMFSQRNGIEQRWKLAVEEKYGDILLSTFIRRNTDVEKAVTGGMPIMAFDASCNGYDDYRLATQELLAVFAEMKRPQLTAVPPSLTRAIGSSQA